MFSFNSGKLPIVLDLHCLKMSSKEAKHNLKLSEDGLVMDLNLAHLHRHDFNPHGMGNSEVDMKRDYQCKESIWDLFVNQYLF